MAYQRKTKDIYELVTNYGYGEEVESWAETFEEIKGDFDAYIKEKMGGYMPELKSIRIRKRRERIA